MAKFIKDKALVKDEALVPSYTFDPVKDLEPVDQFGFVDLRDAFVNHSIPGDLQVNSEEYNGVENPASLMGRSADVFESYRKAQYVQNTSAAIAKAEAASSAANE